MWFSDHTPPTPIYHNQLEHNFGDISGFKDLYWFQHLTHPPPPHPHTHTHPQALTGAMFLQLGS